MKEELIFCSLGNGISVYNRNREDHIDYNTVAHIGYNRDITCYDKTLSPEAASDIEWFAKYGNLPESRSQPYPVLNPVEFSKVDVQELKGVFSRILGFNFKEVNIEVAGFPDEGYIMVFTTKEACEFFQNYYRYMETGIKKGVHHWIFTMYDKGNTNY